jgi:hypothetical protein
MFGGDRAAGQRRADQGEVPVDRGGEVDSAVRVGGAYP